ncbi:DUF3060 domain-containing protein [Mycobacterium sp. NAZ190054]|uniref:DUF3060 domain-containing protein n=1 Tax=Mycobacterium sp. NAZ190054 TaxID=1747766 RepID=UPI00079282D2|nr:DUF3060 domain-containing protein [Mycobacterium sp. NAZ190054]KWX67317.1 hypothetical protein ASJ79_04605 [Mycobacterium sp. NAZ190054]
MEPFGDPEARIRDLERPLSDQARANELGGAHAPHYGGSPYYAPPQRVVHKRNHRTAVWLIPAVVVFVLAAGVAGFVMFGNTGSSDGHPVPVAGGGGPLDSPPSVAGETRIDSTQQVVTVGSGGVLSIGGVETRQTVMCDDGTVIVSGVKNTIDLQGPCTTVSVSGVENSVTVESAGAISASGFDNRVTYRTGEPEITRSGVGNIVERG